MLGEVILSVVLVLMVGLQLSRNPQEIRPSREERDQEIAGMGERGFPDTLVSEPAREGTSLDLLFVNRGEPAGDALAGCTVITK